MSHFYWSLPPLASGLEYVMLDQDDIPGGRNTNLSLVDATANAGGIVSRFGKQHHLHLGYSWPSISSCLHTYDNSDETQHFSRWSSFFTSHWVDKLSYSNLSLMLFACSSDFSSHPFSLWWWSMRDVSAGDFVFSCRKWIVESLNKDRHINIQRHVQHSATAVFA